MRHFLQGMAVMAAVTVLILAGCADTATAGTTGVILPPVPDISVTLIDLTADGSATATTTKLTLTFDKDIEGLSAADIVLNGAVKGTLTKTGAGIYELTVSGITADGSVTIGVSKSGYTISGGSKTVTVYRYTSPTDITAVFTSLTADGSSAATTTKLTLGFDKDITGLSAADIALDDGSTGAVKGTLTRTGTGVYELAVSGITTGGSVTIGVSKSGYSITGGSKTVTVYHYTPPTDIAAVFTSLTADGSSAATTTKLTLGFDKDITGLSAADIALDGGTTGAVKGTLTKTGAGIYELTVSGITANGSVTIGVSKSGYNITGGSKTVTVYRVTASPVRFEYYWVDEHDKLVTTSGGETAVTVGRPLTITAQSAGYVVKQWYLNRSTTGQSGNNTYDFLSITPGKHTVGLFVEKDGKAYNTNIIITVEEARMRAITIDMYDSGGDGWDGNGALRINVNGVNVTANDNISGAFAAYVKVQTTAANNTPSGQRSTNTYTFSAAQRDIVRIYWVAGDNQQENSFIVYYADTQPVPAFTASNNNTWKGENALVYSLRNTMQSVSNGTLLGSFTVNN